MMTFGFTNVSLTFQRMMFNYLQDMMGKFVKVYLDDILIYSESWKDHLRHIKIVLRRLRIVQLYVKTSKCSWKQ
jgi:Reverse transcriptase (RNA-dependent DNA polymerase)